MEILILHSITDADDLGHRLSNLTTDPRVTEHITKLQRHKSGLAFRFSGPKITGELNAQLATTATAGYISLQAELSGLARVFQGAIERTIRDVAIEVLGSKFIKERSS